MQRGPGADLNSSQFEELGYSLLDSSAELSGDFYTAHLYSIRGLIAPDEAIVASGTIHDTAKVTFGIGKRCNELANRITGLDLVEDEDQWNTSDRHRPPFLLLQIGPSRRHRAECGYYKNVDGQIIYERKMFESAHREVQSEADKLTPKVLGAIGYCISSSEEIYLDHLKTVCFGKTQSEEVLVQLPQTQFLIESRMGMKREDLQNALDTAASLANSVSSKSAYLFSLGIEERDVVKRFLFFFLTIESEVSREFKSLSSSAFVDVFSSPLEPPAADLVRDVVTKRQNDLLVKFLWCMKTSLPQLTYDDLDTFIALKKIRDGIAHGSFQQLPSQDEAAKAYRLAARILMNI
jgi:hypothetical protein